MISIVDESGRWDRSFACICSGWAVVLLCDPRSRFAVQQLKPSDIGGSGTANKSHHFPKLPNLNQLMFSVFTVHPQ